MCLLQYFIIIQQYQNSVQQSLDMNQIHQAYIHKHTTPSLTHTQPLYHVNVTQQHPHQLINILTQIQQHTNHPQPAQQLHIIAFIGYTHPVMNKEVQSAISSLIGKRVFWEIDNDMTTLLETLNIVCLIPGFNLKVLNITEVPRVMANSYNEALWINSMKYLCHNTHFLEIDQASRSISKQNIIKLGQFLNNTIELKRKVQQNVYAQQKLSKYDNAKSYYHEIDILIAEKGIITLDYFPGNYQAEFIEIWLDKTVELNSLLGNFVCKEKFGEFQYIRGPLLYAMQKGILLIFNNFTEISNELLISIKSLSNQNEITHNQRSIRANAGFKIIGVLGNEKNLKSKANISKIIYHHKLQDKNIYEILPQIRNEQNKEHLTTLWKKYDKELGYNGLSKFWKRIERVRKTIINYNDNGSKEEIVDSLWNSYFTSAFLDDVQLELNDLLNKSDKSRVISYQEKYRLIEIGRTKVYYKNMPLFKIVTTQYSLAVLEKLSVCFQLGEYPLLVSETGCGKTTLVQYLAELSGHKLYVYNMSSGTDVTDLIGGFKPIDCRILLKELFYTFLQKFRNEVPNSQKNQPYLLNLNNYFIQGKLQILLKSLIQSIPKIIEQLSSNPNINLKEWTQLITKFSNILSNYDRIDSNLVFNFLEGNLIKAIKNGDWILIDEINLATNDVLQKIVPLIEGKSLMLYEKGDLHYIERHKDFRIVACMNPANDSGKKPLPMNLSKKFTTIIMSEPNKADIEMMVTEICPQLNPSDISSLYFNIKGIKTISLRNLSRALHYINKNKDIYGWNRSAYDGLMLGFGQKKHLAPYFNDQIPKTLPGTIQISGFLLNVGSNQEKGGQIFHLTETFSGHLKDFLRAIAGTQLPVLLQGPTSAGKTSMIRYVADTVGYKCIRINNHEHTEIEEYIGNYFPDKTGKLVFREGPLVKAVCQGYWLILDELNLAKTQILECLNRLLDDNRELFIPEQQRHIKPHKNFRIFATQNPSSYSGRKTLSRAFRNRFVSISFNDINIEDMMAILQARSPLVKDSKQVGQIVKKTLQSLINYRQRQRVFEKDGLITIRNLLKWSQRKFISKQKFIVQGYAIFAQKLRNDQQKKFVQKVLLSNIKYTLGNIREEYNSVVNDEFSQDKIQETNIYVQMNDSFKRMAALTMKAIDNREPVLLVGQTGCGKTTLAELIAALSKRKFFSINCHKHMEASDLLGSLRPSLNPNSNSKFEFINGVVIDAMLQGGILLIDEINTAEDSVLQRLNQVLECGLIGIQRGEGWETVQAKEGFCIIATMNPSGDYGKKQLSPALRNRFTQIWVQPITHPEYIIQAKPDILKMITHKLTSPLQTKQILSPIIYEFVSEYNCNIAERYNMTRKLITMRDIAWICRFINECQFVTWQEKYFWSIVILAVEGLNYIMAEAIDNYRLKDMKKELIGLLGRQIQVQEGWMERTNPENIIEVIKNMNFPILIKTDIPLPVLNIHPQEQIFFSPQTDLSDMLGQYRPQGNDFVWHDEPLLHCIKTGGIVALVDLNLAQQQVIEGINSLFDHRGSLFVVELNETFYKVNSFKPIVVLRHETGNGRKGLPNSFLNRFVKLFIPNIQLEVKMNYLQTKYPSLATNTSVKTLISKLLEEQKGLQIEQIQFVIEFSEHGILKQALKILKMDKYLTFSSFDDLYSKYEAQILEIFPLKKSININQPSYIKAFINIYLIYKYSRFNICLIGNNQLKFNMIKALSYFLNLNLVKILISTMVDINDLLGAYEQIAEDEKLDVQENAEQYITKEEVSEQYRSQKTKFAFIQSRIIKSLKENSNLVYIQVPNEMISQRIQKGLKDIYNQKRKIVLGIDTLNAKKSNLTKFITINLNDLSFQTVNESIVYQNFIQNQSNLKHKDLQIRRQETSSYFIQEINKESERKGIMAWRRLLDKICNKSDNQHEINKADIKDKLELDLKRKYDIRYVFNEDNERLTQILLGNHIWTANNKQSFINKMKVQCFFLADHSELHKKLIYFNDEEEELFKIIKKFQILYTCNVNNFKKTAKTILPLLFKTKNNSVLINKYFNEIERLYEQLFKYKIKEILVQFNDEQHKLIPILSNVETIRYVMISENYDVRSICEEGPHIMDVLTGIEQIVVDYIRLIEIDIRSIGNWCKELKIKSFGHLQIFTTHLMTKSHLFNDILGEKQIQTFLEGLNLTSSLYSAQNTTQKAMLLFNKFKPHKDMSMNIGYHLKNEINYKFLNELIANDQEYIKKYKQFCKAKYFGHFPEELHKIDENIQQKRQEIIQIQKILVYRGHNNIQNLLQFYQKLQKYTEAIELNNFHYQTIRSIIVESYHGYFSVFNDVLIPFYIPLIIIYAEQVKKQSNEESIMAKLINQSKESVVELIEEMIKIEEGQVDQSKDYLRFQKKFNKTVIIDEYTQQGKQKNKQIIQEEFNEIFGKHELNPTIKFENPFEKMHMLINKTKQNYYPYLSKILLSKSSKFQQIIINLQIMLKYQQKHMNIYEEYSPSLIKELLQPLPAIMEQIFVLINKYQIDTMKNLANICHKIQQRSIYEEVYKVLIDCEFLIEKVYEINAILPISQHVNLEKIISNCLQVRKLQLKNWKQMMNLKIRRTQKSDMIEFISLYKTLKQIQNEKQLFVVCETYLRESKISCINSRIKLLLFLQKNNLIFTSQIYKNTLFRILGFYEYLTPDINEFKNNCKKEKEKEMRDYEKLAGWSSNEYLIFKATCQKFQRKIHHILRRFDDELTMNIGTYHQQILAKQYYNSVKEFHDGLNKLLDNKVAAIQAEESDEQQGSKSQDVNKEKEKEKQPESNKEQIMQEQVHIQNIYETINSKIFQSLKELQLQHHNTQSKLLIIRNYLGDLEDIFSEFTLTNKVQYKFLSIQMFESKQMYERAVKYYYGLWDKLCLRSETKWNRQIIDRLWSIIQKIWVHINLSLKYSEIAKEQQLSKDLKIIFDQFITSKELYHPIFTNQVQIVKNYLSITAQKQCVKPVDDVKVQNEITSLMKLGYILSNIATNLQKNGLCVKEEEEENENSENQEIGEGVGIGQGEAHDGAENIGDEMEYEEQFMGHKDEEKNNDRNAENKEENDIEMQGDFEGQMYSKEEQNEDENQEGKSKEADEQMGDVDQKQKQKDMKNEAGEAEGSEQADVDIKNQAEGQEELIDNQREKKDQRKGEDKRDVNEQQAEQQEQKSDWDENNEQGQKINKQKQDVQAQEQSESFDLDEQRNISSQQGQNDKDQQKMQEEQGQNEQNNEENNSMKNEDENLQQMDEENDDKEGEENGSLQQDQQNQVQEEQSKENRKYQKQAKKYNPAYGRKDVNTNNQVLNKEEDPLEQADQNGDKEQGEGQNGDKGSGNPIHNLSAKFLEQILKQQMSQGNEKFIKDLNVLVHDQNELQANQDEGAQQFELTQQKDKFATNLPLMDTQHKQDKELPQKQQDNTKRQDQRQEQQLKKQENQQQKDKLTKQSKKGKEDKANANENKSKLTNSQVNKGIKQKNQLPEVKIQKQRQNIIQQQGFIKKAISNLKDNSKMEVQISNSKNILSQAFEVSKILEEQLKSVLEPMNNAEYKGDFKTGKKLNLKKIIPFIASNYRKDRIWLRRTQPSERNYYVMIALDDTKSMHYGNVGQEALKGLLAISIALQHLSIKTSVCSIRDEMKTIKTFKDPLNSEGILNSFNFHYESSNSHDLSMASFMNSSLQTFTKVEEEDSNIQTKKLCFIISDGKMNKKLVEPFMKDVKKQDLTYIFIIVDSQQSSILNIKTVEYDQKKKMRIKNYMEDFPFEYFLIINDVKQLGQILALTMMQFIQEK